MKVQTISWNLSKCKFYFKREEERLSYLSPLYCHSSCSFGRFASEFSLVPGYRDSGLLYHPFVGRNASGFEKAIPCGDAVFTGN